MRDRGLRHEERARDLVGREPAEQAKRERHARLGRQHGMARRENQAQQVVTDIVVEVFVRSRVEGFEIDLRFAFELRMLLLEELAPA